MSLLSPDNFNHILPKNNFSLIHFNARSLRKNNDNINHFITSLNHHFSAICISETWLSDSDNNLHGFSSYQAEYCHRPSDSYGGVAIFLDSTVVYTRRRDLSFNIRNCEAVWLEIEDPLLTHNRKSFVLGSVYRSPSSSVPEFLHALDTILNKLSFENKNVLIVGDININLLDTSAKVYTDYTDCFSGYGLESVINTYTRCSPRGSKTLLDHALSNLTPPPVSGVLCTDITDHYPIFVSLERSASPPDKSFFTSVFSKHKFTDTILSTDWSGVNTATDPVTALDKFCTMFSKAVSLSTTTVKCKKQYKHTCNPWMTNALLTSLRKKDNLYRKTKRQPFNTALAQRYKNILILSVIY